MAAIAASAVIIMVGVFVLDMFVLDMFVLDIVKCLVCGTREMYARRTVGMITVTLRDAEGRLRIS
jgi:hypothetical protein